MKKINIDTVDKDYVAQDILMKLGDLYQFESGIYGYGNVWNKFYRNVEAIIIDELDKADCIQCQWPTLQPRKIWDMSNRWNQYTTDNDIMFTMDNNLGEYGLAPTAEECATIFGSNRLPSYKNLPATYYQIGDNCMILKDFPSHKNYFKSIGIKNHQLSDLNELVMIIADFLYNVQGRTG